MLRKCTPSASSTVTATALLLLVRRAFHWLITDSNQANLIVLDGMPQHTLYECQSYFKIITDFALAQDDSKLLVDAANRQKKLKNKKIGQFK